MRFWERNFNINLADSIWFGEETSISKLQICLVYYMQQIDQKNGSWLSDFGIILHLSEFSVFLAHILY